MDKLKQGIEKMQPIIDYKEIEQREVETPQESALRLKEDLRSQREAMNRENVSQDLLRRYYNSEMSLDELHDRLIKVHGNIKPAFEWLLKNARR